MGEGQFHHGAIHHHPGEVPGKRGVAACQFFGHCSHDPEICRGHTVDLLNEGQGGIDASESLWKKTAGNRFASLRHQGRDRQAFAIEPLIALCFIAG